MGTPIASFDSRTVPHLKYVCRVIKYFVAESEMVLLQQAQISASESFTTWNSAVACVVFSNV
jgi:hypothetical protein